MSQCSSRWGRDRRLANRSPVDRAIVGLALSLLVAACASDLPAPLRNAPDAAVSVAQVQAQPERHLGRKVRWGGNIIAVTNKVRETEVEVLARPLGGDGRPREASPGEGRFIARLSGFADPAELPTGRAWTVVGRMVEVQTRPVGEYPYVYPVLSVDARYLWPEPLPSVDYPGGPWGWPWYDPWWGSPWGPWRRPWYH